MEAKSSNAFMEWLLHLGLWKTVGLFLRLHEPELHIISTDSN